MELVPRRGVNPADLIVRPVPTIANLFDLKWIFKCRVRILAVTDSGSGGFDEETGFHIGQVMKIVTADLWPHVAFEFTKAHRQNGAGADVIENFRFDGHDLGQYDQIWMFGIERTGDPLSGSELRSLSTFMDNGGGVFATGDHENLGQAMCAEVPRVRSMRRWYWPSPGPDGEPVAPGQLGDNLDTLVDTDPVMAGMQGSQSDDVPQRIRPRYYTAWTLSPILPRRVRYPHPVLCGPAGVITRLPDHMHEGLCEVPADLSKSYTFDGHTSTEYPALAGHQERPQVIGWATNRLTGQDFGVLAAYDGHRSGVGRVVVDATWHHWFNVNLTGFIAATDPGGPSFDPAVVPGWEEIKSYFRNVAAWLVPPAKQTCLRNGGWLVVLKNNDVAMTLRRADVVAKDVAYFHQLGVKARDALGRLASQCQQRVWLVDLFKIASLGPLLPDPWETARPREVPDPAPFVDGTDLENVVLGGAVHALGMLFADETDLQRVVDSDSKTIEATMKRGAAEATSMLLKHVSAGLKAMAPVAKRMDDIVK